MHPLSRLLAYTGCEANCDPCGFTQSGKYVVHTTEAESFRF